ncbi:MAG: tRNA threonylcarbamoyladenosine dehydratase [Treponema sp.]|nr:tRNA threonylcarbamoyladenosine dehydratase [Treponema sp.]
MVNQFSRTQLLLGKEAMEILRDSHVAVFGVGGVGGFTVEALARCGIGHIDIIDDDKVSLTNLNRQIIALHSTIGKYKVDVMKERILDINPNADVKTFKCFYLPENRNQFDFTKYDYVVDAVDTVTAKINLIMQAKEAGCKIICSMGAGNKLDPTQFKVADISETSVCPLARVMRQECKQRKIKDVKVVFSTEKALEVLSGDYEESVAPTETRPGKTTSRIPPGSASFVPSVAGLIIAREVIKDLTGSAARRA